MQPREDSMRIVTRAEMSAEEHAILERAVKYSTRECSHEFLETAAFLIWATVPPEASTLARENTLSWLDDDVRVTARHHLNSNLWPEELRACDLTILIP